MSRTRVKICGLTREQDVDAAVQAGADAIGLVFYPKSPRAVTPEQAQMLARRAGPWVSVVGLFVNASRAEVLQTAQHVGLSHIQLHGDESAADCADLGRPVIKAIRMGSSLEEEAALVKFVQPYLAVSTLLFDADSAGYGGSGHGFEWGRLAPVLSMMEGHWVLSGGLHAESVGQAIRVLAPPAVDVSSGVEQIEQGVVQRGRKDSARIRSFMAAVRVADETKQ
ncbi:TrpF Phosphoribosylanthranilate isomerase [Burkholderiales bacterium]